MIDLLIAARNNFIKILPYNFLNIWPTEYIYIYFNFWLFPQIKMLLACVQTLCSIFKYGFKWFNRKYFLWSIIHISSTVSSSVRIRGRVIQWIEIMNILQCLCAFYVGMEEALHRHSQWPLRPSVCPCTTTAYALKFISPDTSSLCFHLNIPPSLYQWFSPNEIKKK